MKRQLSLRIRTQNGQQHKKNEARPTRRSAYTWHWSMKCKKYPLFSIVVVMNIAAVLCVCWRSTVHSGLSPAKKYHKQLPVGPFAQYLWEIFLFPPTLHADFAKHPKNKRHYGWKRFKVWRRKKREPQALKCSWRKLTEKYIEPGRLNGVFVKGACTCT